MTQQSQNVEDDPSLFRIMIATDNHLGYLEDDQIRGEDSFNSFDEIMQLTKAEKVDFLLLGGDLFHQHDPSKKTIIRTSKILAKYVDGQRDHNYEVYCYEPNFKNKNLVIDIPIFTIHGNHDYPSGIENVSPIEFFSKELNYFGKVDNVESFELFPILFIKNETKIALYGISSMKDERLYLALQNKKVNFHRPNDFENWFNILVVHQNRFKGHNIGKNKKNYLPENFIPNFFDLIIWGHEHECFTEVIYNSENNFHIYQPGSSVATSLIQAESKLKHIGICEIKNKQFRVLPIKLETVRPFYYSQFELKQYQSQIKTAEDIEHIIEEKIEEALVEIEKERQSETKTQNNNINNNNNNTPMLPLIRIKIEYTGFEMVRTNFIVSKYSGRIANLQDVIQFWKKKSELFTLKHHPMIGEEMMDITDNLNDEMRNTDDDLKKFMEDNIKNYFIEKNIKSIVNPDILLEHLEKEVNGNEPRSVELLFKRIEEVSSKLATNIDILKEVDVLKLNERENSEYFEQIVDLSELNNIVRNYDNSTFKYSNDNRNKTGNSDQMRLKKIEKLNSFDNKKRFDNNMIGSINMNGNGNVNGNNHRSNQIEQLLSKYESSNNNNNNNNSSNNNRHSIISIDDNDSMGDDDMGSEHNKLRKRISNEPGKKKKQYKIEPKKINKKKK